MSRIVIQGDTVSVEGHIGEEIKSFDRDGFKLTVIGLIRGDLTKLEKIDFNGADHAKDELYQFFLSCPGEYAVLYQDQEKVLLYLTPTCPQFYLVEEGDAFRLTNLEAECFDQGFDPEALFLRYVTKRGLWMPQGISKAISDFLIGGMGLSYQISSRTHSQFWVLPLEKFCERTDHNAIADELADRMVEEMKSYHSIDGRIDLQLSSGIDSALMLAASKPAKLKLRAVNVRPPDNFGESLGAKQIAKFFGNDLHTLSQAMSKKSKTFSESTDISKYLRHTYPLLKTGSGNFIIDNISLLLSSPGKKVYTLEGSSYPTALCIVHYASYPDSQDPVFKPEINREKRYKFSLEYLSERAKSEPVEDHWKIAENFPGIDPYYWDFLGPCFTGSAHHNPVKFFVCVKPLGFDFNDTYEAQRTRGYQLISKLLASPYLRKQMESPDPLIASKVMKAIIHLNNISYAGSAVFPYRQAGLLDQYRPGVATAVVDTLYSTQVDETLVDYPKWHIFEAFKRLAGKGFFEVQTPSFTTTSGLRDQARQKYNSVLGRKNVRSVALPYNRSLLRFAQEERIFEKTHEILQSHGLEQKLPVTWFGMKSYGPQFWYANNILNMAALDYGSPK